MRTLILLVILSNFWYSVNAATFTSSASGNWSSASTWTITGVDSDGKPDSDDDVTISSGHTVTADANAFSLTLTVNGTFNMNAKRVYVNGNFTNTGTLSGTGYFFFQGAGTISSTTTIGNPGDWYFQSPGIVIAAGTIISKINYFTVSLGADVTNLGSVTLVGGSLSLNGGTWINGPNSSLTVQRNIGGGGTLDASANPNTVRYSTGYSSSIKSATYHHLVLTGGSSLSSKALSGPVTINGNLSIGNLIQLNANNHNITIGGNWTNTGDENALNLNTVTFNGSGTQLISRPTQEIFNHLTVAGSGTVELGRSIQINGNLTLTSGTFDVSASSFSFGLRGNWVSNGGAFNPRNGTAFLNGSSTQTISGTIAIPFYSLNINNSSGINVTNGTYTLSNTLTISAGTLNNTGGTFTLLSDATTTARIAPLPSGSDITGNFVIERFISARTANWADLSSPVANSTILDWDNEMYMSGVGGADGNASSGSGVFYSVYNYNEPTVTWVPVTSTASPLTPGLGFEIYLGDNLSSWSSKAITTVGKPNVGDQSIAVTNSGDGWNLVGNPFASFIAWNNIIMSGIDNSAYYIYDNNSGTYASYGAGTEIPPTQGFWVWANGSPSMTIPETAKTTTTGSTFYRLAGDDRFTLKLSSMQNLYSHKSHVRIGEGATDFPFLKSRVKEAPSITFIGERDWTIKGLSGIEESVSLPLNVTAGVDGTYIIEASGLEFLEEYTCVILEDVQNGKKINLYEDRFYSFETSAGSNPSRFVLHLSKSNNACEELRLLSSVSESNPQATVISSPEGVFVIFTNETDSRALISVNNILGQQVMGDIQVNTSQNRIKLDIPNNLSGIYFVNIQLDEKNITQKIFVNRSN